MLGHHHTTSVHFMAFPERLCLPLACPRGAFRQLTTLVHPLAGRHRKHLGLQVVSPRPLHCSDGLEVLPTSQLAVWDVGMGQPGQPSAWKLHWQKCLDTSPVPV